MNFFLPIAAAVLQAASSTIDKIALSLRGVNYQVYMSANFPLFTLFLLVMFAFIRPPIGAELFNEHSLLLAILLALIILAANLLYYRALQEDHLSELQTIDLLRSIPVILYSGLIFSDERNPYLIFLALIVTAVIVWSHWEKHHFRIAKHTTPYLIWTLTIAPLDVLVTKELLQTWHPMLVITLVNGIATLMLAPFLWQYAKKVTLHAFWLFTILSGLSAVAFTFYLISLQVSGIVYTVLLFSLQPLLVYLASVLFLKERPQWKKSVAFVIVLLCIAVAQIIS